LLITDDKTRRDATHLHDSTQLKSFTLDVELEPTARFFDALPVAGKHGRVGHGLEQRQDLVEVVDLLLELKVTAQANIDVTAK